MSLLKIGGKQVNARILEILYYKVQRETIRLEKSQLLMKIAYK